MSEDSRNPGKSLAVGSMAPRLGQMRALAPGLVASVVVGMAASFIAEHYGGPVMLFALLIGIALNFLSREGSCAPGIEFASKRVLRVGVGLLGARITLAEIAQLGFVPIGITITAVGLTIGCGLLAAHLTGRTRDFGLLTGGAVAICGASAALAISAVLPKHPQAERDTLFTVIGVTTLSTVAMVLYPLLVPLLGFDDTTAGLFLGGSIHDVAQVVGAGYSVSPRAGDVATFIKLLRVATLLPVVTLISLAYRRKATEGSERPPLLPGFLLGFALLVGLSSAELLPLPLRAGIDQASTWCVITAIAALLILR